MIESKPKSELITTLLGYLKGHAFMSLDDLWELWETRHAPFEVRASGRAVRELLAQGEPYSPLERFWYGTRYRKGMVQGSCQGVRDMHIARRTPTPTELNAILTPLGIVPEAELAARWFSAHGPWMAEWPDCQDSVRRAIRDSVQRYREPAGTFSVEKRKPR